MSEYKPPIKSILGLEIGGTHKAKYRVDEAAHRHFQRETVYIQCNCELGYDHEASSYSGNPTLMEIEIHEKKWRKTDDAK